MPGKKPLSKINLIFCLLFLLSACSPAATASPTSAATAFRNRPTRTPLAPTALLATVTPLPLPTETASPAPTATQTPAPLVDFSTASLYSAGILPRFQALITIKVNAKLTGEYYGIVQGNKLYTCTTFSDRPHLLYCTGPLAGVEKYVHFELFQKGLDYPIFQADAYMPLQITLSP